GSNRGDDRPVFTQTLAEVVAHRRGIDQFVALRLWADRFNEGAEARARAPLDQSPVECVVGAKEGGEVPLVASRFCGKRLVQDTHPGGQRPRMRWVKFC